MKTKLITIILNTICLIGYSQLPEEYIEFYKKRYDNLVQNDAINQFHISEDENIIVYKNKLENFSVLKNNMFIGEIKAENIISIIDSVIYFTKENLIQYTSINNLSNIYKFSDKIIKQIHNKEIIELLNDSLYIFKENKIIVKNIVNIVKSNTNNKIKIFNFRNSSIIEIENKIIEIKDSIKSIIIGEFECLILGKENNYISNNFKKDIEIYPYKINENIINTRSSYLYFHNNNIYNITYKKIYNDENYIKPSIDLKINLFYNLANEIKINSKIKCIVLKYNIIEKKFKQLEYESPINIRYKNGHIFIQHFENLKHNLFYWEIINLEREEKLKTDSLNILYSNTYLTIDGKYLFVIDKNNLYRINVKNNSLKLICKNFESLRNEYEYDIKKQKLDNCHYNFNNESLVINTKTYPFIIDKLGNVDSITYRKYFEKNTINYLFELKNNSNKINLLYRKNLLNNISSIIYITDEGPQEITKNENYKSLETHLDKLSKNNGYFEQINNTLIWSEHNLENGIEYFSYNLSNKNKNQLFIKSNKLHDSLKYKYLSIVHDNKIITGGLKFPKFYDSTKKYPIVITIYLKKTDELHILNGKIENYSFSALMSEINLLHQGYIVGYIDVPIENGVYNSNSKDINYFIDNVLSKEKYIDINNIGILGHSRSAGQVMGALIDSNSKIKCAIISNGNTSELLDLVSFRNGYLDKDGKYKSYSRFSRRYFSVLDTEYTFRNLANNFEKTINNDQLMKLENLNASILFLFNDKDESINKANGYFMYLKSKILNKNTYFMNFIDDTHTLNLTNAKIFYRYAIHYLNFYLKNNNTKYTQWQIPE